MVATKEQFKEALRMLIATQWSGLPMPIMLLQKQYMAPNHSITVTDLAKAVGARNVDEVMDDYSTMARAVAGQLAYTPIEEYNGEVLYLFTLSTVDTSAKSLRSGFYSLKMRPQLTEALAELKWF